MYRIGVDIGGTFTDVVVARDTGDIVRAKGLTTPHDYTEGVSAALANAAERLGVPVTTLLAHSAALINGTTVVTNAIAQQRGRRVGLLTTAGFKQQIYIHRGIREIQLDLQKESRPPDIVPQRRVVEINERVNRKGEVLVPLDEDSVREQVRHLVEHERVEALAVCYLWAFRYPEHERRTLELVAGLYPELFVTLSSDIYPRIREYERMNTAVLNSFVSAGVETYIGNLSEYVRTQGLPEGRLTFMQSLGGRISEDDAMAKPIQLSHSGPVGGVVAACHFAALLDEPDIITADVGGTSFDTALIRSGRPTYAHRTTINRLLTGLSTVDIHAIGAGGGSIAWVDERGIPQLGPHSAGADPGPACYGNGGTQPTITDANLLLGLIDPEKFWGGALFLDVDAARRAFEPLAERLGRTVTDTATGYYEIAVTSMSTAISTVSLGRGYDPRDSTVLGYGGGSGLFLAQVCRTLGINRLVMPRAAATFSAYGLLFSDSVRAEATTAEWFLGRGDLDEINSMFQRLEDRALGALHAEGFDDGRIELRREADVKFAGQSFEIALALPMQPLTEEDREVLAKQFVAEYERTYGAGSAWEGFPVQFHTARVVATGATEKPPSVAVEVVPTRPTPTGSRTVHLRGGSTTAATYDGAALLPGAQVTGPAVVDDVDTTLLVPDGMSLRVDGLSNYVFSTGGGRP
jgi:N-methylhydantoinase A